MRETLAQRNGLRSHFTGQFQRFGTKPGYRGRVETTVLLIDVKDAQGEVVTDHLWFNLTKGFEALDLQPGDLVAFDARVKVYWKGYRGRREDMYDRPVERDYKLDRPTNVRRLRDMPLVEPAPVQIGEQLTLL